MSDAHFTAESTEAMCIKCLAQGHDVLMQPGFGTVDRYIPKVTSYPHDQYASIKLYRRQFIALFLESDGFCQQIWKKRLIIAFIEFYSYNFPAPFR